MEKMPIIKKISKIIVLVIFFTQAISSSQVLAEEYSGYYSPEANIYSGALKLDWENPNKNGNNPYQLKVNNVLSSGLIMNVIGCTGVVNKVSKAISGILGDIGNKIRGLPNMEELAGRKVDRSMTVPVSLGNEAQGAIDDGNKIAGEDKFREQCLNGIAYTLAKNQLTAMTRYTMNWITSGFKGDPMYVRDTVSFMNSITDEILLREIEFFRSIDQSMYPYGRGYARSRISSWLIERNFREASKQTLTPYLDGTIADFSNDFSVGGWGGWLAMTTRDENNIIGYNIAASDYLAEQQEAQVAAQKEELAYSSGMISTKKCISSPQVYIDPETSEEFYHDNNGHKIYLLDGKNPPCLEQETITPGSSIASKLDTYLNSPERQLEIADSINEVLNSLFSTLIAKFQMQGLTSLNPEIPDFGFGDDIGGYGSNALSNNLLFSDNSLRTSGFRSFDLIRGLGNIYVKEAPVYMGNWNALDNIVSGYEPEAEDTLPGGEGGIDRTKLFPGIGEKNTYYTVIRDGNTKLFEGNTGWVDGERAYFDGKKWQKWTDFSKNPIAQRGIIQIQQDYIVATREALRFLPSVMPVIGELDYCIPGPNPNWKMNSDIARDTYFDYLDSIKLKAVGKDNTLVGQILKTYFDTVTIGIFTNLFQGSYILDLPKRDTPVYKAYNDIFEGSELWGKVLDNELIWVDEEKPTLWAMIFEDPEKARERLEYKIGNTAVLVRNLDKEYHKEINKIYGKISLMQTESVEKEDASTLQPVSEYLEMSKDGLAITKNILQYNESVEDATQDYKNSIIQANVNINKLDTIRKRVNQIVKNAQKRRASAMEEAGIVVEDIPAECFEDEEILFIDDSDLVGGQSEVGRCSDGIDNDLDGKIDLDDYPDCPGSVFKNQCEDELDNDTDGFVDTDDPDCHTDFNPKNPSSYRAKHYSEVIPPLSSDLN